MSDDTQEPVAASEETVEFSESHFGEPGETQELEEAKPEVPAEDAQKPESPAEPETPEGDKEPEETPEASDEPAEEQPVEEKSETELKGMTRAERKEYFESLKQDLQPQVERAIDENYQAQPLDELKDHFLNEGYDEFQATMLAKDTYREQQAQLDKATTEIVQLNANLQVDSFEAQAKYDWMNKKSDSYDKDLHQLAADLFAENAVIDPKTGQIIDAKMTPTRAAQIIDKARNSGIAKAQLKAQKAAEQQMAAAAPPTSSVPSSSTQSAEDVQAARLEQAIDNAR